MPSSSGEQPNEPTRRSTGVPGYDQALRELGSGVPFLLSEAERLAGFLATLPAGGWGHPSRSAGWTRHDIVAHLASGELYNEAVFGGTLAQVDVYPDDEAYNRAHVALRRQHGHQEVHEEWRRRRERAHGRFVDGDPAAMLQTSAGPYPLGLQAWHIGMHYATHNDDLGLPIREPEVLARARLRARFGAYMVTERGLPHRVSLEPDRARITCPDTDVAVLSLVEFVDLVVGYLDPPSPGLAPLRGLV